MRRLAIWAMLVLTAGQAFADITLLLGPDGNPLPNGAYRLLVIPSDATKPPVNTVLHVGGGITPPTPPVPPVPPDTLDARLTLLLAAVDDPDKFVLQSDPTKPGTGAKLKVAYEMTLQLTANSITDANSLRGVMAGIEKGVLDSMKKTAGWQPWTAGLSEIVKPLDFAQCLTTYRAAAAKLGGGPVPPPPPPPPPPQPGNWSVTGGLHVMIVDDENLRGKLPQSQINIFTSSVLRQWLDKTCPKAQDGSPAYRLASNDSLADGGEARKQELPVYVQGWDLLMKSGVALPAWIVANGQQTTIEPLPKTVDEAIARLEALK